MYSSAWMSQILLSYLFRFRLYLFLPSLCFHLTLNGWIRVVFSLFKCFFCIFFFANIPQEDFLLQIRRNTCSFFILFMEKIQLIFLYHCRFEINYRNGTIVTKNNGEPNRNVGRTKNKAHNKRKQTNRDGEPLERKNVSTVPFDTQILNKKSTDSTVLIWSEHTVGIDTATATTHDERKTTKQKSIAKHNTTVLRRRRCVYKRIRHMISEASMFLERDDSTGKIAHFYFTFT